MKKLAGILALVVAANAHAFLVPQTKCGNGTAEEFNRAFFTSFEAATSAAQRGALWDAHFSPILKMQLPKPQFEQTSVQLAAQLGLGKRPFAERVAGISTAVSGAAFGGDPTKVVVITHTLSDVGRVEQRLILGCEQGAWRVFGLWYAPARY